MKSSQEFIQIEDRHGAHNYKPLDVVLDHGEGVWVWDVENKKYLDCLSGYSALSQGHRHPKIVRALTEQANKLTLTSRAFRNSQLGLFFDELCAYAGYERALPMNTGAEAVETAIKMARKWGYTVKGIPKHDAEIIVAANNFHGRTTTVISFSTEPHYREFFGPYTPGFVVVPFDDAKAIENAMTPNTCAVLIEPVQGEAGVIVPRAGYLRDVAAACKRHNVLFIADEIQTGLGRTGARFASDHDGVRPDAVILGKALGGGMFPVSAVVADPPVLDVFEPGEHGSTFGGNPLAAAVGRASLSVIVEEKLAERAAELGEYFIERLAEVNSPHVKEVRGKGLLIGVELYPEAGTARAFCEALLKRGVLCKDTRKDVMRFAPPLVVNRDDIDWAMQPISDVLRAGVA